MPYSQELVALAKPCMLSRLGQISTSDPTVFDSVYRYIDGFRQCQLKTFREGTEKERQIKYGACLKTAPARPEKNIETVCAIPLNHPDNHLNNNFNWYLLIIENEIYSETLYVQFIIDILFI